MGDESREHRQKMSTALYVNDFENVKETLDTSLRHGYHFIIIKIYKNILRNDIDDDNNEPVGIDERALRSNEWNRLIVGELITHLNLNNGNFDIKNNEMFEKELGFASYLGLPAVWLPLTKPDNLQLANLLSERLPKLHLNVWVNIPMKSEKLDTWKLWNKLHSQCNYDHKLGLALDLCHITNLINVNELKRWIGEPIKALVIPTSFFIINQYNKPVLAQAHQEIIKKLMPLNVQYVIKPDVDNCSTDIEHYNRYIHFLGKKLYTYDALKEFVQGYEDLIQNPLQPLTENLEGATYEIFEKDNVKYYMYQKAIYKAVQRFPLDYTPVVMVVGAGRGPLVQAVLNVAQDLDRKIKIYAVEKNPYAVNTLMHRINEEWKDKVVLIHEDMRCYQPEEKADILVSELLGSFGDNELSPECLDGAQRFLKEDGISIPESYTSFLAPVHSVKLYNEIKKNMPVDKTLLTVYETPYIVHLANCYQLAPAQDLFTFKHPNWELTTNQRYKKLQFQCEQTCLLTAFAGFFETVLYRDVDLSINPETHTPELFSWFPIIFSLPSPIHLKQDDVVEVSFWRKESKDQVWYEWCLNLPVQTQIFNSGGQSYAMKK